MQLVLSMAALGLLLSLAVIEASCECDEIDDALCVLGVVKPVYAVVVGLHAEAARDNVSVNDAGGRRITIDLGGGVT